MRVRTFELRLIAAALSAGWTLAAGLVLLAYHPGGPIDLVVGVMAGLPILIALAGLAWPPVARGGRAFAVIVALGVGSLLVLAPSIGGVLNQLLGRGPQTLLPSLEAGYPWILALFGTSLFSGLGMARRLLGETALRRPRLVRGVAIAGIVTVAIGSLFAGAAVANDIAIRDRPSAGSRFGPTLPEVEPPTCDQPVAAGSTAGVDLTLNAEIDGRPIGTVDLHGVRSGSDYRWGAYVATNRQLGQYGGARIGGTGWRLEPGAGWRAVDRGDIDLDGLDDQVLQVALEAGSRVAAEMRGLAYFEGARARHCRVAIDGTAFRAAFPQVRWLVGEADLGRWRGELDYWVFVDGELGRVSGSLGGEAFDIVDGALQGRIRATMTATERDRPHAVVPPR